MQGPCIRAQVAGHGQLDSQILTNYCSLRTYVLLHRAIITFLAPEQMDNALSTSLYIARKNQWT